MSESIPEHFLEQKESEPKHRKIDLYFIRHGEAEDQGAEAALTEPGKLQTKQVALQLLEIVVSEGGGVIKIGTSSVRRALETADIIQEVIGEAIASRGIQGIDLMTLRKRDGLKAAGVIGALNEQGISDPIEYWLRNPNSLEGKNPAQSAQNLQDFIDKAEAIAKRLLPGKKIYYFNITHEVPQAAFLNQKTNKTLNEMGGNINNCEFIKVAIDGDLPEESTKIAFREGAIES
jgi:broad specificity phosphatase PhoE